MYLEISHSYSIHSAGRKSFYHRSQDTSHSTSSNHGGCGRRSSLTRHASSRNCGGYVDRSESMPQETIHYYSYNQETAFDVEGRSVYMSQTSHDSFRNQGERGKFLTFLGDTVGGDGRVRYMSHTNHSPYQIGDSRGVVARHGSMSEEINHSPLFNIGESVDGVGRS